jgi:uncharacterized protein (TIGR02266 family)
MAEEKRSGPRGESIAEVSLEHEGHTFHGRIGDLSQGGFYVDTVNPLSEGARITFRFCLPGRSSEEGIVGEGVVAWQRPFQGMGIRFTWLSDEDKALLTQYLAG